MKISWPLESICQHTEDEEPQNSGAKGAEQGTRSRLSSFYRLLRENDSNHSWDLVGESELGGQSSR